MQCINQLDSMPPQQQRVASTAPLHSYPARMPLSCAWNRAVSLHCQSSCCWAKTRCISNVPCNSNDFCLQAHLRSYFYSHGDNVSSQHYNSRVAAKANTHAQVRATCQTCVPPVPSGPQLLFQGFILSHALLPRPQSRLCD